MSVSGMSKARVFKVSSASSRYGYWSLVRGYLVSKNHAICFGSTARMSCPTWSSIFVLSMMPRNLGIVSTATYGSCIGLVW